MHRPLSCIQSIRGCRSTGSPDSAREPRLLRGYIGGQAEQDAPAAPAGSDPGGRLLVIGTTNRKDLIEPALLRPGRFDVQVELGLPDEADRQDILRVHLGALTEQGRLGKPTGRLVLPDIQMAWMLRMCSTRPFACAADTDVDVSVLAGWTESFTGAELEVGRVLASLWG